MFRWPRLCYSGCGTIAPTAIGAVTTPQLKVRSFEPRLQFDAQDYYAIDWDEAAGNSVFAQKSGGATVSFAGWRAGSFSGYGYWVVLDLGTGSDGAHYYSYYAHLQDVSVSTGNTVFVNNVIGHSGCSDSCTGPHVHSAWVKNPTLDTNGQPYNGTGVPQSPLNTYNSQYPSYNPLSQNEVIHGH